MRLKFWGGAVSLLLGVALMYWGTTAYLTIGGISDPAESASDFITGLLIVSIAGVPIALGVVLLIGSMRS